VTRTSVDIIIPVLNEEGSLASSLTTLAAHLDTQRTYDWCITVVDNGSTDQTFELATAFATANSRTRVIRLEERGRGRALKQAWSTSTADVVAIWTSISPQGLSRCGRYSIPSSRDAAKSPSLAPHPGRRDRPNLAARGDLACLQPARASVSALAVLMILTLESSSSAQRTGTSLIRAPLRWARARSSVSKNHPLSSIFGIKSRATLARIALNPRPTT
jgi:Glycosyl transferase family 2